MNRRQERTIKDELIRAITPYVRRRLDNLVRLTVAELRVLRDAFEEADLRRNEKKNEIG